VAPQNADSVDRAATVAGIYAAGVRRFRHLNRADAAGQLGRAFARGSIATAASRWRHPLVSRSYRGLSSAPPLASHRNRGLGLRASLAPHGFAGRRRANALGKVAEGAHRSATGPAVATHRSSAPATDRGSTDCVPRRPLNRPAAPRIAIREVRSQLTACYGARHPRHGMDRLRTTLARCSANSRHARAPPAGTTQASPSSHRQGPATVCLASPCENHRCPCDDDKIVAVVLCNPLRCPSPRGA
jgi:hypothetical protein